MTTGVKYKNKNVDLNLNKTWKSTQQRTKERRLIWLKFNVTASYYHYFYVFWWPTSFALDGELIKMKLKLNYCYSDM